MHVAYATCGMLMVVEWCGGCLIGLLSTNHPLFIWYSQPELLLLVMSMSL